MRKFKTIIISAFLILFSFNSYAVQKEILELSDIPECQEYYQSSLKNTSSKGILKCEYEQKLKMLSDDKTYTDSESNLSFTGSLIATFKQLSDEPEQIKGIRDTLFLALSIWLFFSVIGSIIIKNATVDNGTSKTVQVRNRILHSNTIVPITMMFLYKYFTAILIGAFTISIIGYSSVIRNANETSMLVVDESPLQNDNSNERIKIVSDKLASDFLYNVLSETFEINSRVLSNYSHDIDVLDQLEASDLYQCIQETKKSYSFSSSLMSKDSYALMQCQSKLGSGIITNRFVGVVHDDTETTFNQLYELTKKHAAKVMQYTCYANNIGFYNDEELNIYNGEKNNAACLDYRTLLDDGGELTIHETELTYKDLVNLEETYLNDFFLIFNTYANNIDLSNLDGNDEEVKYMRENPLSYFFKTRILPFDKITELESETSLNFTKANDFVVDKAKFFGNADISYANWKNFNLYSIRDDAMKVFEQAKFTITKESSVLDTINSKDLNVVKKFLVRCDDLEREKCNTVNNVVPYITSIYMTQTIGFGATYGTLEAIDRASDAINKVQVGTQQTTFKRYLSYMKGKAKAMFMFSSTALLLVLGFGLMIFLIFIKSIMDLIISFYLAFLNIIFNSSNVLMKTLISKIANPTITIVSFIISNMMIMIAVSLLFDTFASVIEIGSLKLVLFVNVYTYMYILAYVPLLIVIMSICVNTIENLTGIQVDNTTQQGQSYLHSVKSKMRGGF